MQNSPVKINVEGSGKKFIPHPKKQDPPPRKMKVNRDNAPILNGVASFGKSAADESRPNKPKAPSALGLSAHRESKASPFRPMTAQEQYQDNPRHVRNYSKGNLHGLLKFGGDESFSANAHVTSKQIGSLSFRSTSPPIKESVSPPRKPAV